MKINKRLIRKSALAVVAAVIIGLGVSCTDIWSEQHPGTYYTSTGEPLLLGYPGADYIKVAISNGDDLWHLADLEAKNLGAEKNLLWEMANLKEDTTVSIILSQKAKYLTIQQARDIHYYDERDLYATDEEYANFRAIKVAS